MYCNSSAFHSYYLESGILSIGCSISYIHVCTCMYVNLCGVLYMFFLECMSVRIFSWLLLGVMNGGGMGNEGE